MKTTRGRSECKQCENKYREDTEDTSSWAIMWQKREKKCKEGNEWKWSEAWEGKMKIKILYHLQWRTDIEFLIFYYKSVTISFSIPNLHITHKKFYILLQNFYHINFLYRL